MAILKKRQIDYKFARQHEGEDAARLLAPMIAPINQSTSMQPNVAVEVNRR